MSDKIFIPSLNYTLIPSDWQDDIKFMYILSNQSAMMGALSLIVRSKSEEMGDQLERILRENNKNLKQFIEQWNERYSV